MYYYMKHMKGCRLKRFFPALAWGVSCIFFLLVILFICYEYIDYRSLCNIGVVDDGIDELHTTLLSVGAGALACLFVIACVGLVGALRSLKVRPLKTEPVDAASVHSDLDAALQDLQIDKSGRCLVYRQVVISLSPRVTLFLDVLVRKENHVLSPEELNGLFYEGYYDGTESGHSRVRNIKYKVHIALQDTPFDVVRDASGNLCLVLKS